MAYEFTGRAIPAIPGTRVFYVEVDTEGVTRVHQRSVHAWGTFKEKGDDYVNRALRPMFIDEGGPDLICHEESDWAGMPDARMLGVFGPGDQPARETIEDWAASIRRQLELRHTKEALTPQGSR